MKYVSRTITTTCAKVAEVKIIDGNVSTTEPVEFNFEGVIDDKIILKHAKKTLGSDNYVIISKVTSTSVYRMPIDVFMSSAEVVNMEVNTND